MIRTTAIALCLTTGLASSLSAQAANPTIERTHPLDPEGQLSVTNVAGDITIRVGDDDAMHLVVTPGDAFERLVVTGDASSLEVEVIVPEDADSVDGTDMTLRVPAGVAIALNLVSGHVDARGLRGALAMKTVSADVVLDVASKQVEVGTVSGDIELIGDNVSVDLGSVSGDIRADGVAGTVVAETVSGRVRLTSGAADRVDAQSVSGDLELTIAALRDAARVSASTLSGDVDLRLAGKPSARVAMKTFSGRLASDIDPAPERGSTRHRMTLGSGAAKVNLSSFSGDLRLRGDD